MINLKMNFYKLKRLLNEISYLRKNFYNWDNIIKRFINGRVSYILNHRSGLNFHTSNYDTLGIFNEIFIKKVYEFEDIIIEENDVIFDIGGNIGLFALYASRFKGTKVFSFEPHPENYQNLVKNIKENAITNIYDFNFAIGSQVEERVLIKGINSGTHKLANFRNDLDNTEGTKVSTVTTESIMLEHKIDKIDFMKIDCEGAEGEIIKSLELQVLKKIKKMIIEFHDNQSILNHTEICEVLESAGFFVKMKKSGDDSSGYIYAKQKDSDFN